ncbi:hypothetical protein GCM10010460_02660 [Microbacterium terrae]|nr:hypothetical protein GCM10017594_00250 [Microbacterium terrae]
MHTIGDLETREARVLPQVTDDGRLHDVPEQVDGILRVFAGWAYLGMRRATCPSDRNAKTPG